MSGAQAPSQLPRDIVLLHGWGTNSSVFDEFAREFTPSFRTHALNFPGYGDAAICQPYTLNKIAESLAARAPQRCHVIGWSLGALAALIWAKQCPQQVARIALIAATPCFARREDWHHGAKRDVLHGFGQTVERDRTGALLRFASLQALGELHAKTIAHRLRAAMLAGPEPEQAALLGGLQILDETDLRDELAAIKQPVLVLHGDHDTVTPPAAGSQLVQLLPDARFHLIHGTAHAPFLSMPAQTAALVAAFFDE